MQHRIPKLKAAPEMGVSVFTKASTGSYMINFSKYASDFHTHPKSGFGRIQIPRIPRFRGICHCWYNSLREAEKNKPETHQLTDTQRPLAAYVSVWAYLEHRSIFCRHSRRLPQLLCFFYSVHQSERQQKKEKKNKELKICQEVMEKSSHL